MNQLSRRIINRIAYCLLATFVFGITVRSQNIQNNKSKGVKVQDVTIDGVPAPRAGKEKLQTSSLSKSISFTVRYLTNIDQYPLRIRYKLEGYDKDWHETPELMRLALRFVDARGNLVTERSFSAAGQSQGWNSKVRFAEYRHRSETVIVPTNAATFSVTMTSAGPAGAVGTYIIANLRITDPQADASTNELLRLTFENQSPDFPPVGWERDGLRPDMAKVVDLDPTQGRRALAIEDDRRDAHAEWRTTKTFATKTLLQNNLMIEWDEAYSIGSSTSTTFQYPTLPVGLYQFRVGELTVLGSPTELESTFPFEVIAPFWKTPRFLVPAAFASILALAGALRYVSVSREQRRMRREVQRLEHLRAIEQERIRIARDIHDDLGARVTQISLYSVQAQHKPSGEDARNDLRTVSKMTRELMAALYETVWAVNPDNDNIESLANFTCHLGDQFFTQAQLRCRVEVPSLPKLAVTSQTRHNVLMAVKEAFHNIVKHAQATEVSIRIAFETPMLTISIQDNGAGFDPAAVRSGNGLRNMKQRLNEIGGTWKLESRSAKGTTVTIQLPIPDSLP